MLGKTNAVSKKTVLEELTITAGTADKTQTAADGKGYSKVTVAPTPSQAKSVTPGASQKTVTPDAGKLLSQVTVSGDVDLVAKNIRKGIDIFGITGTLAEGVDLQSAAGLSKINVNKVTFSTDQEARSVRLQHSLGVIPKIAMILSKKFDTETASDALIFAAGENLNQNSGDCNSVVCFTSSWGSPIVSGQIASEISYLEFTAGSGYKLTAGTEYTVITLA